MDSTKTKRVLKRIAKILLILIIFILISTTNGKNHKTTWIEDLLTGVTTAPQRVVSAIKSSFFSDDETSDIEKLQKENALLKKEIEEYEAKLSDYDLVLQENKKLKENENAADTFLDYKVLMADIIFKTQNNYDDLYTINKGKESGIEPGMTVITTDGLVGFVKEAGDGISKIVSILDVSSSFSAVEKIEREQLIVKGDINLKNNNQVKATQIIYKDSLKSGDVIETSGIGGVYPKGLKVGKVSKFIEKANPLENEAIIDTFVNFNKLERVAIIITKEGELGVN